MAARTGNSATDETIQATNGEAQQTKRHQNVKAETQTVQSLEPTRVAKPYKNTSAL